MTGQANAGNGQGASPCPGPGLPGGPGPRLAGFAAGGAWDACPPSAALAAALEEASGPGWRCAGATRQEMLGLARQWQALEARAAAGKFGVLRALIRDDDQPLPGAGYTGDLPQGWTKSLTHEVALALAMPAVSADKLMWLAWDLEGRLPGIGALLAAGALTGGKARGITDALVSLSAEDARAAEALVLQDLPGKTYGQAVKLATQAAVTVDPESEARRRQDAERESCRVQMFREQSGAAALSGRDLPADQTLTAFASVCARAVEYAESGAFPDGTRMDQYRASAYLDLLNGIAAHQRISLGVLAGHRPGDDDPPAGRGGQCGDGPGGEPPVGSHEDGESPSGEPDDGRPSGDPVDGTGDGPGSDPGGNTAGSATPTGGPGKSNRRPDGDTRRDAQGATRGDEGPRGAHGDVGRLGHGRDNPAGLGGSCGETGEAQSDESDGAKVSSAAPSRLADLVIPLTTLLGLAERPGEGHGLGPLDPDLCRALAAAVIASQHSRLCVTVTNRDGIAIGHGCARPSRRGRFPAAARQDFGGAHSRPSLAERAAPLPARVNLTVTADRLAELVTTTGPPDTRPWNFTRDDSAGGPNGHGTWTLTLPDGRSLRVELRPVPTYDCGHQYESHAYQPNDTLRHLVQVRDGECTFPTCSRHARESDFEHAIPYEKGGLTCACNAGARSRACHRVKQSAGWNVTQPRPGWHQWETPSGRTYTQGPKRYPV